MEFKVVSNTITLIIVVYSIQYYVIKFVRSVVFSRYNVLEYKKSLKIPKGQSENVHRRTDNTMAKRKSTKGQTTIDKTYK